MLMKQNQYPNDCCEDLIPTRKSLLGRLKDWQDNESWKDFFDTYWRLIYGFAIQRGLNHEESQEVVEETVVAVAKRQCPGSRRSAPPATRPAAAVLSLSRRFSFQSVS